MLITDRKKYARDYYIKNKEKIIATQRSRYQARSRIERLLAVSTPIQRYSRHKRLASNRGVPFEITLEQYISIVSGQVCNYCRGPLPISGLGLDRKDNSRGYIIDNVVPCCRVCNDIKGKNLTYEEMRVAIEAILEYRRNK